MNREEHYLEENTACLIQAAYGPDVRPSPKAGEQTFRLLLAYVRARSAAVAFPDAAVGALGAMLALMAVWLTVQTAVTGTPLISNPSLLVIAAWLILNLALVPVASIVILIGRQRG